MFALDTVVWIVSFLGAIDTGINHYGDNCLHVFVDFFTVVAGHHKHCVSRVGFSNVGPPLLHALCGWARGACSFSKRLRWACRNSVRYFCHETMRFCMLSSVLRVAI